ncbi:MAG TPA: FecR domain-containing protein [Chryseolinea sp.]
MKSEKDFDKVLKRYLKGNATEEEVNWIEKWYSSLEMINRYPELNELQRRKIVDGSFKKIQNKIKGDKPKTLKLWPALSAAAAVILLIVAYIYNSNTDRPGVAEEKISYHAPVEREIKNETSAVKHIVLSDSTRIALEPKSSIQVAMDFNQVDRKIFLTGEAFFNVSHNRSKPFYVDAGDVVTKVLGTSFRIRAFSSDKNITVAVKTGKVAIQTRADKKENRHENVILAANQQAIYSRDQTSVSKALVEAPQPLKPQEEVRRKLKFEAAPFRDVIDALEDIYGIEIKYQEDVFESCKVTTTLSDGGIYSRLNIICKAIGASYSQKDGIIVIAGKGCQ